MKQLHSPYLRDGNILREVARRVMRVVRVHVVPERALRGARQVHRHAARARLDHRPDQQLVTWTYSICYLLKCRNILDLLYH